MSTFGIEITNLTMRYGATKAVDGLSATIQPGAITGLLGRNGSGKSTLLAAIAGFRPPASGSVTVQGRKPFEDEFVMANTCLVREAGDFAEVRVDTALRLSAAMRPHWSQDLARHLIERFKLPTNKNVKALSRGQRSALGAVVGLASQARITMFDEVYLGMDAPTRYAFYEELLSDYAANPRTIVISSHLIEEVERLFEHVLVLDEGKLLLQDAAESLREQGVRVVGNGAEVERFVQPYTVLNRRHLGRTTAATLYGNLTEDAERRAAAAGLDLESVSIQDLFVHLTERREGGHVSVHGAGDAQKEIR